MARRRIKRHNFSLVSRDSKVRPAILYGIATEEDLFRHASSALQHRLVGIWELVLQIGTSDVVATGLTAGHAGTPELEEACQYAFAWIEGMVSFDASPFQVPPAPPLSVSQGELMLAAVREEQASAFHRLVAADALEDDGRKDEAEWLRVDARMNEERNTSGMVDPLLFNQLQRLPRPWGVDDLWTAQYRERTGKEPVHLEIGRGRRRR